MDVNLSVIDRYSAGTKEGRADLCCPMDYDCGNPSRNDFIDMLWQDELSADYRFPTSDCP